jgi:hypothetical protein
MVAYIYDRPHRPNTGRVFDESGEGSRRGKKKKYKREGNQKGEKKKGKYSQGKGRLFGFGGLEKEI